jgi:hypothetical protein
MRRAVALIATALALGACEQTLHLFPAGADAGAPGGSAGGRGGASGGAGGSTDGGSPDGHCSGSTALAVTPDAPQMVVVLDRSTNMAALFDGSETQLDAALNALAAQIGVYGSGSTSRPSVQVSAVAFPDQSGSNCQSSNACCAGDVKPWAAFQSAVSACEQTSSSCGASGNRPIKAALAAADAALTSGGAQPFQRYVLLVTDGPPSGCDDCTAASTEISTLTTSDKINLSIVGLGTNKDALGCLLYPSSPGTGQPFWQFASGPTELQGILTGIMQSAACSATLSPPPQSSADLQVAYGRGSTPTPLTAGDRANGWIYAYGHLHLYGSACQMALGGWADLKVTTGCGSGRSGSGGPP